jgi:hypothetical protein
MAERRDEMKEGKKEKAVLERHAILHNSLKSLTFLKVKLVRLRRPKRTTCSPSYSDYRPKANTAKLLDMDHTRDLHWRDREKEGNQKLE